MGFSLKRAYDEDNLILHAEYLCGLQLLLLSDALRAFIKVVFSSFLLDDLAWVTVWYVCFYLELSEIEADDVNDLKLHTELRVDYISAY